MTTPHPHQPPVTNSPADVIRRAAALMRERAEKAEPGRWKLWGMDVMTDPQGTSNVDDCRLVATAATPYWCDREPRTWNATHIASWHPDVALEVADLLDATALTDPTAGLALSLARAYLGESTGGSR